METARHMQFSGRYHTRNGSIYEVIKRLDDGRWMGAEVKDKNAPELTPQAWSLERVYWDDEGNHVSDRGLDLMELIRAGKNYR